MKKLKGLLKSRTFWFNIATLVLELSNLLVGILPAGYITVINALANVGLRIITNKSLEEK